LTVRAAADLREARTWSRARWGKELTDRYFKDLHKGAQYIAENRDSLRDRSELAGGTAILLYPVREHYIVYETLSPRLIAIVAVIRQSRDIGAILQKWAEPIRRELTEIRSKIERGEIQGPSRSAPKSRRKK
jgi:plasmid stabilization system protein ParE